MAVKNNIRCRSLKCKLVFSQELRRWFSFPCYFFLTFFPIQLFHWIFLLSIGYFQGTPKLFQRTQVISLKNTFWNAKDLLPVNNTASRCSNNSNVPHPFYKIIIQKVWSTILLKNNIFIYGFCKFIFPRVYCCTIKTESIIFLSKVFYS